MSHAATAAPAETPSLKTIPAAIGAEFAGGVYAGIMRGLDGAPDYHLVLLPGDAEGLTFQGAIDFAASADAHLPTRREQRLLFINLKDQFQEDWYWSGEQHASYPSGAWGQNFNVGFQFYSHKDYEGRVRVVRRLSIQ